VKNVLVALLQHFRPFQRVSSEGWEREQQASNSLVLPQLPQIAKDYCFLPVYRTSVPKSLRSHHQPLHPFPHLLHLPPPSHLRPDFSRLRRLVGWRKGVEDKREDRKQRSGRDGVQRTA